MNMIALEDTLSSYYSGMINKERANMLIKKYMPKRSRLCKKYLGHIDYKKEFKNNWDKASSLFDLYKINYRVRGSFFFMLEATKYRLTVTTNGYILVEANDEIGRYLVDSAYHFDYEELNEFFYKGGKLK